MVNHNFGSQAALPECHQHRSFSGLQSPRGRFRDGVCFCRNSSEARLLSLMRARRLCAGKYRRPLFEERGRALEHVGH
jgi:hypothetical protein